MKISSIVLALLVCQIVYLTAPPAAFCQTETFDIIHYTPPKGWTKSQKEGVIIFSDQNKPSGGFCVLTVYSKHTELGQPAKGFREQME